MKMPASTRRPIQMMARRKLKGLDSIMSLFVFSSLEALILLLREKLIEKLLENVVAHRAGIGIRLAFAMKDRGGGLVDAVHLAHRIVLVNKGVHCARFYKLAHLGHLFGRKNGGNRAVHIATLFPLLLVLIDSLFHRFCFSKHCGSAGVPRGNAGV